MLQTEELQYTIALSSCKTFYSKHLSDRSLKGSKTQRLEEAMQIHVEEEVEYRLSQAALCILVNALVAIGESVLEDLEKQSNVGLSPPL